MNAIQPGLFGLKNSNKDFTKAADWGKNVFNNTFPAALACYLHSMNMNPVYLMLGSGNQVYKTYLPVETLFGIDPLDPDTFYSFERDFAPFQPFVVGSLPRADLVVMNRITGECASGIEIKLTALPDNATHHLTENRYGCEIVVRPDTIVYLALSIATGFAPADLQIFLTNLPHISNWTDPAEVAPQIIEMERLLSQFMQKTLDYQRPLVMQPVWKTEGKKLTLHQNAFDIFVWSNYAFTRLFLRDRVIEEGRISRGARSIVWLTKMLHDFAYEGKIDHKKIIDSMSFNTKNDKAFAANGVVTRPFMDSEELNQPRIRQQALRNIILGGGEKLLSPERRLDAAILGTPSLFSELS